MQMYIILNTASGGVCFNGNKPFIGQLRAAKDHANFLKSVNPSDDYVLAKVTMTNEMGVKDKRYSAEKEKKDASRKRAVKAKSMSELRDVNKT